MTNVLLAVTFSLILAGFPSLAQKPPPPCPSEIYCHGPLLHAVQTYRVFGDSKTFVDKKLKWSPEIVLQKFAKLSNYTRDSLERFVLDNFDIEGSEFETWNPPDWKSNPKILEKTVPRYKNLTKTLNFLWKNLGRKMKPDVKSNPTLYSIIYVPNPAIIPGGRFREFYYWDSYWIILGLLQSEMYSTAKGMIENYIHMVENLGHIPNGGRIYYNERSQPPLLIPMVKAYHNAMKDVEFLRKNIGGMQKEFDYWLNEHSKNVRLNGIEYKLSTYGARIISGPRPESYYEDFNDARYLPESQKDIFYSELKAAAESGWDFSSRWFIQNGTNKGNLSDTHIRSIVPVDLNAILYWNSEILSEFNTLIGNASQAQKYKDLASQRLEAITKVLWDETRGVWLDYDLLNAKRRDYFSASNLAPLWTGAFDAQKKEAISKSVLKYLDKEQGILPGGVPTTNEQTGEQWDFPNAWPPLQYIVIMGLENLGTNQSKKVAWELAQTWIESNAKAFNTSEGMFEKYDATKPGIYGGGGEYTVQMGFGWTNGIILELFDKYSDELTDLYKSSSTLTQTNNLWKPLIALPALSLLRKVSTLV